MSLLFEPITLGELTVPNRIWLSPMCQYSVTARDGVPGDWHLAHYGARATGGFGLLITEAAAIRPDGRISPQDCGLWNDAQVAGWARIVEFVHSQDARIAVQLAHAGRKACTHPAFPGRRPGSVPQAEGGWQTVAPSEMGFPGLAPTRELGRSEVAGIIDQFAQAAVRADRAGFDAVEVHAAHGYLLHQFCSPLSNQRTDEYGGDFAGRTRIVVEVVDAVRAVWPAGKPVIVRLSATDWLPGGWDVEQTSRLAGVLSTRGVDLIDVSSGGLLPSQQITPGPGYQTGFARQVRQVSGLPTGAVGLITEPQQAEQHLTDGDADVILLGREGLREPYWPLKAAQELGWDDWRTLLPPQYHRSALASS
ncbi:MAG: NADH:flavin oxidoreductase/NADH oxidase [Brooklawnia sp.]|jgi:2,4-dienoyl-CoA reductase-like NADH-dependent reductase (Old Yellow Enzyme family)